MSAKREVFSPPKRKLGDPSLRPRRASRTQKIEIQFPTGDAIYGSNLICAGKSDIYNKHIDQRLWVECGHCWICARNIAARKAGRMMMEYALAQQSDTPVQFACLTLDPEKHSDRKYLYADVQNFMKRIRRIHPETRYAVKPEIGEINPDHYHLHFLLYGGWLGARPDAKVWEMATKLWPYGISEASPASPKAIRYVSHYTSRQKMFHTAKESDDEAMRAILQVCRIRWSQRPALGHEYLDRYARMLPDIAPPGYVPYSVPVGDMQYPVSKDDHRRMRRIVREMGGAAPPEVTRKQMQKAYDDYANLKAIGYLDYIAAEHDEYQRQGMKRRDGSPRHKL